MTNSSADVNVAYQDNVTIFCTAMSLESNVIISWSTTASVSLPDTTTVPLGNDQYKSSLTLTYVGLDATGVYTCTASGSSESDNENITVTVEGL